MFEWLRDWIKEGDKHKRALEDLMAQQAEQQEQQELEARWLRGECTEQETRDLNLASIRTMIQREAQFRQERRIKELVNGNPSITAEEVYKILEEEEGKALGLAFIKAAIQNQVGFCREARVRELGESPGVTAEEIYEILEEEGLG